MGFPAFFADAPTVSLVDPLAVFLGASDGQPITYSYADAVKLSGHSCPTVAGAYLLVVNGLRFLYGEATPERGGVEVFMADPRDEGTTGVMANVAMLLTGAAPETGFGGIGGRFGRRNLLHFDAPIDALMGLRRIDTGRGVLLDLDASGVPPAAEMRSLLPLAVNGRASAEQQTRFGEVWQDRVRAMLLDHADDPDLVLMREWPASA